MMNEELNTGETPFSLLKKIPIQNNNRIWMKEEYFSSPCNTHYDRVYSYLFPHYEKIGKIIRGKTHLLETTSGNAGTSFAWYAKSYGYKSTVFLPKETTESRIRKIKSYGAEVIISEKNEYIKSVVEDLQEYLSSLKKQGKSCFCFNHSQIKESVIAMESCGFEILKQAEENNITLDYFISALGNGTSLKAIGSVLKNKFPSIKIVGFEPRNAPVVLKTLFPEKFLNKFGKKFRFKRSSLVGTGVWGVKFPHLSIDLIDDILHLKENEWMDDLKNLWDIEKKPVGYTSGAALWTAKQIAKTVSNKNILILLYDKKEFYNF